MTSLRGLRSVIVALVATGAFVSTPQSAFAIDPGLDLKLDTWTSNTGHAYVGVKAAGHWAPPAETSVDVKTNYYTFWENQGNPNPGELFWWIWVVRTIDNTRVNVTVPIDTFTTSTKPGIGIKPAAFGDMRLYLAVGLDPRNADTKEQRTVSAQLTEGWTDALGNAVQAHVIHDSVHVARWTVDFGDGSVQTYPPGPQRSDQFSTTHSYDPGDFDAVVTAHVVGEAYGAFFTPDGEPFEKLTPFELDIRNSASGMSNAAVEYEPPIVFVGASCSGALPDGTSVTPDETGHQALSWPRGLHCALHVRPIIDQEGFMASGDAVVGDGVTRLVSYRYPGGVNDAAGATPPGTYGGDVPIAIQWNTPLVDRATYPVTLTLDLETTYDDGTVVASEATGTVPVTIVYSAVSQ
jgi:hypothetical protein